VTGAAIRKYLAPVAKANRRLVVGAAILLMIAIIEGLLAYSEPLA